MSDINFLTPQELAEEKRRKRAPKGLVKAPQYRYRCVQLDFLKKKPLAEYNHWDSNIVDISGALFALSLSLLILNSQYEEGARDINNI